MFLQQTDGDRCVGKGICVGDEGKHAKRENGSMLQAFFFILSGECNWQQRATVLDETEMEWRLCRCRVME